MRLRSIVPLAVLLGFVAAVAGFLVREPIERALLTSRLSSASGYDVAIGGVAHRGDALVLESVRLQSPSRVFIAELPSLSVERSGARANVVVSAPRLTFSVDRWRGGFGTRLRRALGALGVERLHLTVRDGSVLLSSGVVPQVAGTLQNVAIDADSGGGSLAYDARAVLDADGAHYAIAGSGGGESGAWKAAALPLALLGTLGADAQVRVPAGTVRDATFRYGPAEPARFEAHVENAEVLLEDGKFITGLHGPISYAVGMLGSRGLNGYFGTVPFSFAGEVRDLGPSFAWLWLGSPQLRGIVELTRAVAAEPALQSMRVETIAPGLDYAEYAITGDHGPLAITVLAADPRERSLRFDTAIASDAVVSGGERTSAMGVRTHAVGGVNGDYFDIGRTYQPQGMLMSHGELLRGPTDRAALVVDRQGRVTFGEFTMAGSVDTPHARFPVTQLNSWPAGDVTVITPRFGKILPAAEGVTFAALAPIDRRAGRYRVTSVRKMDAPLPVTFGVAFGKLLAGRLPRPGEIVTLHYGLSPRVPGAVAAIGGGPLMIKDGAWFEDPHAPAPDERDVRWPVIALAKRADGMLLLVAVDGRHPERSVGMTRPEFGGLLLRLGATDAMALDSGGSVTLVARAPGDMNVSVRNHPSDDSAERWVSDALLIYSDAPPPTLVAPVEASTPVPEARPSP